MNYVDGLLCQGRYQITPPTPFVPAGEVAMGELIDRRVSGKIVLVP